MMKFSFAPILLLALASCQQPQSNAPVTDAAEIEKLDTWFAEKWLEKLLDSPEFMTRLGIKTNQDLLNNISEEFELQKLEKKKIALEEMAAFDTTKLDEQSYLSYRLYRDRLKEEIHYAKFRHYDYPVNQMFGLQSGAPSFMFNMHKIKSEEDALNYVRRLNALATKFDQLIDNLKLRAEKGIIAPKFVFTHVLNDCQNILGDTSNLEENVFIKDLQKKLAALELGTARKSEIVESAKEAVRTAVTPAYEKLIATVNELQAQATEDDGVWKFPEGDAFYAYRLRHITTTDLTPDEVFNIGKSEVERIHSEMNEIKEQVGFEGDLQAFFKFMRSDAQFYKEDSEAGKEEMLAGYKAIIDDMEGRLDELFYTKPKARMIVKAVEPYREKSAGKAFYQRGAADGSRPGTFYANLYKMADMPTYEMEALAYHEGIPGHHMQLSIAQELEGLPEFRKYLKHTAYTEGWGLYCEWIPKEMGYYSDPYSDFGRLAMEIWRACRLVVDVGLHHKKWTRQEAIDFLKENTPASENGCTKAIERYIVMPGQATAYKIGMLKLIELRKKAEQKLGEAFDVRKFHDVVLLSGSVPLNILEERVEQWTKEVLAN